MDEGKLTIRRIVGPTPIARAVSLAFNGRDLPAYIGGAQKRAGRVVAILDRGFFRPKNAAENQRLAAPQGSARA